MAGHDIIVIGTSAGGLKALTAIVSVLPAPFDAAVFVVQHLAPDRASYLPQILADTSSFTVVHPHDGEEIRKGVVYVAPPDHHMLLSEGSIMVRRGPRENRFRPSIDVLFRSAARAFGPRVVGVVLTGLLDDGTVGLQAVRKRGGITVVQDPNDAEFDSMPGNALRYVEVDYCLRLAEIAPFLAEATKMPADAEGRVDTSREVDIETDIAEQQMNVEQLLGSVEALGTRSVYTCPACNGSLWQIGEDEPLRFRCHVGHAFTAGMLLAEQTRSLENALWSAIRLMEEKASFARGMAQRRRKENLPEAAVPYEEYSDGLEREVATLRKLVVNGLATHYVAPEEESSG